MMLRKPRIAIYGRHSTDKQNPSSSADQAAACVPLVGLLNGEVVGTYLHSEMSGYKRNRPGLTRMLAEMRSGNIDVVVCEALDRLARDGEDVNWIGKKLRYDRVRLYTLAEGEIDEVKLAVAGMLGSLFLSNLQQKTLRGMQAALLAGRFVGGRAYGYRKVHKIGSDGEPIRGLLEINEDQAAMVCRIFEDFANGLSSIGIVRRLNEERIPGPRGGEWNASTVRGDPKKLVGILNNRLYCGELVWKRREWRKNPDTDDRERRYRLRDESEWVRIDVPDMRIINDELWDAVREQIELRSRDTARTASSPVVHRRRKHLLSGTIKCATCGSNFTIAGKDYYRCAGARERGTCTNLLSLRREPLETAVLSVLRHHLLQPELAELFVAEFRKGLRELTERSENKGARATERLAEVDQQIDMILRNMLVSEASPALHRMLAELEQEKRELEEAMQFEPPAAELLPHSTLLRVFKEKVDALSSALNDESVRVQAAELIGDLIESVTVYPGETPEAEVSANITDLIRFAANENGPEWAMRKSCSAMVVAGVGFEPTTFRL
ncbi:hypothetical protein GRI75_10615 [Altererythrobacter soli]|uniref:Recombinase family protein n=1 Tax=Croceibacterium soli TaxID=1739690 RepID=A0A6I4UT61_9SPHN|nr:recombinase family protein [Croceibacterium soli]MXP42092.1 hypothetical protein [Croceibacterium soli]